MSSLHNDLDGWASKARSRGLDSIYITNETAHKLAENLRSHQELLEALKKIALEDDTGPMLYEARENGPAQAIGRAPGRLAEIADAAIAKAEGLS